MWQSICVPIELCRAVGRPGEEGVFLHWHCAWHGGGRYQEADRRRRGCAIIGSAFMGAYNAHMLRSVAVAHVSHDPTLEHYCMAGGLIESRALSATCIVTGTSTVQTSSILGGEVDLTLPPAKRQRSRTDDIDTARRRSRACGCVQQRRCSCDMPRRGGITWGA